MIDLTFYLLDMTLQSKTTANLIHHCWKCFKIVVISSFFRLLIGNRHGWNQFLRSMIIGILSIRVRMITVNEYHSLTRRLSILRIMILRKWHRLEGRQCRWIWLWVWVARRIFLLIHTDCMYRADLADPFLTEYMAILVLHWIKYILC